MWSRQIGETIGWVVDATGVGARATKETRVTETSPGAYQPRLTATLPPAGGNWSSIILTLQEHRRHVAQLLGCLDDVRRDEGTSMATVADGRSLIAYLSNVLARGDSRLQDLVVELDQHCCLVPAALSNGDPEREL